MPKNTSHIQNKTLYIFPGQVRYLKKQLETLIWKSDLAPYPMDMRSNKDDCKKNRVRRDLLLALFFLDANFSRSDKRKARVVSATLSTCSLDLLGIFFCLLLCFLCLFYYSIIFLFHCVLFFGRFHCFVWVTWISFHQNLTSYFQVHCKGSKWPCVLL